MVGWNRVDDGGCEYGDFQAGFFGDSQGRSGYLQYCMWL